MVQQIVISSSPYTSTKIKDEGLQYLQDNGYTDLSEELIENDTRLTSECRTHPGLIEAVEELPQDSVGFLQIVEIPDDVDWYLGSKLSQEIIVEEHRTWP